MHPAPQPAALPPGFVPAPPPLSAQFCTSDNLDLDPLAERVPPCSPLRTQLDRALAEINALAEATREHMIAAIRNAITQLDHEACVDLSHALLDRMEALAGGKVGA